MVAVFWSAGVAAGTASQGESSFLIDGIGSQATMLKPTKMTLACNGLVAFIDSGYSAVRVFGDVSEHHRVRTIANKYGGYGYFDGTPEESSFEDVYGLAATQTSSHGRCSVFVFDYNSAVIGLSAAPPARLRRVAIENVDSCNSVDCYSFKTETIWYAELPYGLSQMDTGVSAGSIGTPPTVTIMHPSKPFLYFFDGTLLRRFTVDENTDSSISLRTIAGTPTATSGPFAGTNVMDVNFLAPQDMEWSLAEDLIILCSHYVVRVVLDTAGLATSVTIIAGSPAVQSAPRDGSALFAVFQSPSWIVNIKDLTEEGTDLFMIGGDKTTPPTSMPSRDYGTLKSSKARIVFSNTSGTFVRTLFGADTTLGSAAGLPISWRGTDLNFAQSFDAVVQQNGISGTHILYFSYSGVDERTSSLSSRSDQSASHQIARWTLAGRESTWLEAGQLLQATTDFSLAAQNGMVIVAGGKLQGSNAPTSLVQGFKVLDTTIDNALVFPSLNFPRFGHASVLDDINGISRLCVIGGLAPALNAFGQTVDTPVLPIECLLFEADGLVSPGASWTTLAELKHGRSFASAAALRGAVYLVGGTRHCTASVAADCFPAIGTALDRLTLDEEYAEQSLSALPVVRFSPAVVATGELLYTIGGFLFTAVNSAKVPVHGQAAVFDPDTNMWNFDSTPAYETLPVSIGGDANIIRRCAGMVFGSGTTLLETIAEVPEEGALGSSSNSADPGSDSVWTRTSQIIDPLLGNEPHCAQIGSKLVAVGAAHASALGPQTEPISAVSFFTPGHAPAFAIDHLMQTGTSTAGGWQLTIFIIARYGSLLDVSDNLEIELYFETGVFASCANVAQQSAEHVDDNTKMYSYTCEAPPGVGVAKVRARPISTAAVDKNIDADDASLLVAYGSPQVIQILPQSGTSSGGSAVLVSGTNFVPSRELFEQIASTVQVSFGKAVCGGPEWVSSTEMRCISPPGVGGDFKVQVEIAGRSSDPGSTDATWSFQLHSVLSFSGGPFQTAGGGLLKIFGTNFGLFSSRLSISLGDLECSSSSWQSDSEVHCTVPPGIGQDFPIIVNIQGRDNSQTVLFSYAPPSVIAVVPSIGNDIAGGSEVIIQGLNFGDDSSAIQVFIGAENAASVHLVSQSQVNIVLPRGVGKDLRVSVEVGGQQSPADQRLSYAAPQVDAVSPTFGFNGSLFLEDFTIFGENFGNSVSDVGQVRIGGHTCQSVVRVSRGQLLCSRVTGTFSASRSVRVSVGGQTSGDNSLFTPVGAPKLDAIDPVSADGGERLVLFGSNFGFEDGHVLAVKIGTADCLDVALISPNELECTIPRSSGGINLDVRVTTVGGLSGILAKSFSFSTSGSPPNMPFNVSGLRPVSPSSVTLSWVTERNTSATTVESAFVLLYSYKPSTLEYFTLSDLRLVPELQDVDTIPSTDVQEFATRDPDVRAMRFSLQSTAATPVTKAGDIVTMGYSRLLTGFEPEPVFLRVVGQNPLDFGPLSETSDPCPEQCSQSQYLSTNLYVTQWRCKECPRGAFCGGGNAENIVPLAGWYFFPPGSSDEPEDFSLVRCQNPAACTGYDPATFTAIEDLQGLQGAELCADRYTGNLCHRCEIGTARSGPATCAACKSNSENVLVLLGGFLLILVVLAVIIILNLKAAGRPGRMEVMLAKIVVTHLSTISLASSFNLSWPTAAEGFFEAADSFATIDSSIISPDCVMEEEVVRKQYMGSTYLQRSVVTMILPFVIVPFLALMWLTVTGIVQAMRAAGLVAGQHEAQAQPQVSDTPVARLCKVVSRSPNTQVGHDDVIGNETAPCGSPATADKSPTRTKTPWWGGDHFESFGVSVIIMLFMAHVTLTRSSLSLLTCVEVGDGNRYMLEDLEVQCGSSEANKFQYGIGLMGFIFYGIGIPALAFVVLFRRRHLLTKPRNMRVYGFIYSGFKTKWYYWESLVSLRKVGISFAAIFLGQVGPFTQALAAQLILVIAAVIHARARPYTRVLLNNMESLSIGVSLVTFIGGLYLFSEEASSAGLRTLLTTIIIGSNAVFLSLAAYFMVATMMGWHKVHWVGKTLVDEAGEVLAGNTPAHDTSIAGRTQSMIKSMRRMVLTVNATMGVEDEEGDDHISSSAADKSQGAHLKRASLGLGVASGMASQVRVVEAIDEEQSTSESGPDDEKSQPLATETQKASSGPSDYPLPPHAESDSPSRPASTGQIDITEDVCAREDDTTQHSRGTPALQVDTCGHGTLPVASPSATEEDRNTAAPETPVHHVILNYAPSNPRSLNDTPRSAWESKSE